MFSYVYSCSFLVRCTKVTTTAKTGFSDSWTKATSKHCANTKHGSAFSTLTAAQDFCLQQGPSACSGVYDDGCDGKGSFYACKAGNFDTSSIGSCIYTLATKDEFRRAKSCAICCMLTCMCTRFDTRTRVLLAIAVGYGW